jgi:putative transferase (TIGR04331 family)
MSNGSDLFLALTPDESLWDSSKDIVFLGEEVCSYTSSFYDPEKILLPEYWEGENRITDAIDITSEAYENILRILSKHLNEIHGLDNDTLYWRRIIGFFLRTYIDALYDKYIRIKQVLSSYPKISIVGLSRPSFCTSDNAFYFSQAIRESDSLNLQLFSQILTELGCHTLTFTSRPYSILEDAEKIRRGRTKGVRNWLIERARSFINRGTSSRAALYVSLFSNRSLIAIILRSKFTCWPIIKMGRTSHNVIVDREIRKDFRNIMGDSEFESLVISTLEINWPTDFLESFAKIRSDAISKIAKNVPKAILTGIGFAWDTDFSVWAAECAKYGSTICGIQHGGTYGEVDYVSKGESFERSVVDRYVTWGWVKDETTIPLPPSRLIGLKKKRLSKKKNVLWVTSADSRYVSFFGNIVFGNRYVRYFSHQSALLHSLSSRAKQKIRVRLYTDDFGWKLRERWGSTLKDIQFTDNSEPLMEQAQKYELLVIDHFGGTSTLECLRLDIPLVIVGNRSLFSVDSGAEEYYGSLEKVGVLFFDPYSAAKMIELAFEDVESWWAESARRQAVEKFIGYFAMRSEKPISDWCSFITDLTELR